MALKNNQIRRIRELRGNGLSVREIARRAQVPSATVHRYVRDVKVYGHHPVEPINIRSKSDHGRRKIPGRYIGFEKRGRLYDGLLIHLPDLVTCPTCNEQSNDIVYCLDCGKTWIADCGHGSELEGDGHKGINLAELTRVRGDGELHVFPLVFKKGKD